MLKKHLLYTGAFLILAANAPLSADTIFKNGFEQYFRLNDTGITWAADYLGSNNASCTSNITAPQDCHQGRDNDFNDNSDGVAGFSFTKIDAAGNPLAANASTWSCVKDNVTGLLWEHKNTDNSSIHFNNHFYQWGGVTHLGSNFGTYYNDWDVLVNGTNGETLCGKDNWRVPTNMELMSLVNIGTTANQRIDTNFFPNVMGIYWSAYATHFDANRAQMTRFDTSNAISFGVGNRTQGQHVILVSQ